MAKADYEKRLWDIAAPLADSHGFEMVDTEYVKEGDSYYLRLYLDKEGGITIDDIVLITREINPILDEQDFIKDAYIFEVSSPGIERPFKREKDFEAAVGEEVFFKTYKAVNGAKEFLGTLKENKAESIVVEFDDGSEEYLKSDIALIRRYFEYDI